MSQGLSVGFARGDISPTICSVPLGGFSGTEFRLSGVIGDPLYVNAVALREGEETLVYLSTDLLGIPVGRMPEFREAVSAKTGVPQERIFITASHSHSGPELRSNTPNAEKYRKEQLAPTLADAAYRALKDLKPAKLSYGSIEVGLPECRMNYDRHYYCVPVEKKDSYTKDDLLFSDFTVRAYADRTKYCCVEHLAETDPILQVMLFKRDGADDVMFVNFTAHATFVGTNKGTLVSSDWPGATVQRLEALFPGTKCAFLQGCCGNLVPGTKIEKEGLPGLTIGKARDHHAYGSVIAGCVHRLFQNEALRESESDCLRVLHEILPCEFDHTSDAELPKAQKALELFKRDGHTHEAKEYCYSFGYSSIYTCIAIENRAALPAVDQVELNVVRIGDCAIATLPFEAYCSTGLHVKASSPFAMTIANAYCNGYQDYLTPLGTPAGCYESTQMLYVPGTAERVEEKLAEMLGALKEK